MKIFRIEPEIFNKIVKNITFDELWEDIIKNEDKITGGRELPRLWGGLSHYVWTDTRIEIHDIGTSNGNNIYDNSFCILPEAN